MGKVVTQDVVHQIHELIGTGQTSQAASKAARMPPRSLIDNIDYYAISNNAEKWFEFTKLWITGADTLARPEIAAWLVNTSVSEMSYLKVQNEAAVILARVVREATHHLATLLDQALVLDNGPDAGLTRQQAAQYAAGAVSLRECTLP